MLPAPFSPGAGRCSSLFVMALALLAAGCGIVGEERGYYMKKDWERIKGPFWDDAGEDLGAGNVAVTAKQKEAKAELGICGHPNSQERVVTQNGVSDAYQYRRCPLAAYDQKGGSRMGIRPDGHGTVVK
jgi:hypothetical protein